MPTSNPEPPPPSDSIKVEWNDVVRFVRQLSHDLRNHLNAVELQSAYLAELASDPELKDEIKRMRQMASQLGTTLQKLSASVAQAKPTLMAYRASDFLADIRQKLESDHAKEAAAIDWDIQADDASIQIDPQLLQQALLELFANAFRHHSGDKRLKATGRIQENRLVFTLSEPNEAFSLPTDQWGRQPLRTVTQGHYGLGLNRTRAILESLGGSFSADYDKLSSSLVTTVTLPGAPAIS